MAQFYYTLSNKIENVLGSGLVVQPVVAPDEEGWNLINSFYLDETSQLVWVWSKEDIKHVNLRKNTNGDRVYSFSCDFCKKETWFIGSSGVTNEIVGTGDGITTDFYLSHGSGLGEAIIDLSHYKVTDENLIKSPNGTVGGYIPIVKVNGERVYERDAFETSGGNFTIDYTVGKVSFFNPPQSGHEITASYFYSPSGSGPIISLKPNSGKKIIIDFSEVQFSSDVTINDCIVQNVFLDYPVFISGQYITTLQGVKATTDAEYGHFGNYLDYTFGSHPVVPAIGGPTRGTQNSTVILRWDYIKSLELLSSLNMNLKVWTKHNRGFFGERATVTIYGLEIDE